MKVVIAVVATLIFAALVFVLASGQTVADIKDSVTEYRDDVLSIPDTITENIMVPTPTVNPDLTLPTPGATKADGQFDQLEMAVALHYLVNVQRKKRGRSELDLDLRLMFVAQMHSEDMAKHGYYSHTNRAGDNPTARARKAGYNCQNPRSIGVAENIHVLYGHTSMMNGRPYAWETQDRMIQRFVEDWISSPMHSKIMLDPRYTKTGIGVGFGPYNGIPSAIFVTQKFC